jgi:hypothetical protein
MEKGTRFAVKILPTAPETFAVWDLMTDKQHDLVPYVTKEHAQSRVDLANAAWRGELDHLRDPRVVTD